MTRSSPPAESRSSTSRSSPTGRGLSAGRPRTPTPPNSATSSARRHEPGTSTTAPTTSSGPDRRTASSRSGGSRYPGGLTEVEEDFAIAMTSHAKRRKRRQRVVVSVTIALLLAGLAVVGSFWRRSVRDAHRAEANELVAHGQLELESYPSATVAYAIASLERFDNPAARRLAVEALWKGPTVIEASKSAAFRLAFSPDGRSLVESANVVPKYKKAPLSVIRADGSTDPFRQGPRNFPGYRPFPGFDLTALRVRWKKHRLLDLNLPLVNGRSSANRGDQAGTASRNLE